MDWRKGDHPGWVESGIGIHRCGRGGREFAVPPAVLNWGRASQTASNEGPRVSLARPVATGVVFLIALGTPFLGVGLAVFLPVIVYLVLTACLIIDKRKPIRMNLWVRICHFIWFIYLILALVTTSDSWFSVLRDYLWLTGPLFSFLAGDLFVQYFYKEATDILVSTCFKSLKIYFIIILMMLIWLKGDVFIARDNGYFNCSLVFVVIASSMIPGISLPASRAVLAWTITIISMSRLALFSILPVYLLRKVKIRRLILSIGALLLLSFLSWKLLTLSTVGKLFVEKIGQIFDEITLVEVQTASDAYKYWRPFELLTGINYYLGLPLYKLIFGNGLGAQLPLGGEFYLAGQTYSEIPILHNGISYLYLKSGMVGFVVIFVFLVRSVHRIPIRLQICLWIYFLLGAFSITGPFHPQFTLVFFTLPFWRAVHSGELI